MMFQLSSFYSTLRALNPDSQVQLLRPVEDCPPLCRLTPGPLRAKIGAKGFWKGVYKGTIRDLVIWGPK